LTLDELREAIFIEINQPHSIPERLPNDIHLISSWCENLIVFDEEEDVVQFAHHTVREFLTTRCQNSELDIFHIKLKDADHFVGEICVTYLNFGDFKTSLTRLPKQQQSTPRILPSDIAQNALGFSPASKTSINALRKFIPGSGLKNSIFDVVESLARVNEEPIMPTLKLRREHPFLEYASAYWLEHTREFKKTSSKTWDIWQKMVEYGHSWAQFPWTTRPLRSYFPDPPGELPDHDIKYLTYYRRPNQPLSLTRNQPLNWAFTSRHAALVWLIFHSVAIIQTDQTPEEIDITLLAQSIHADSTLLLQSILWASDSVPYLLQTPIYVLFGHSGDIYLPRGNSKFNALQSASSIFEREQMGGGAVHVCGSESIGKTALHFASEWGNPEIVRLLLAAGADANAVLDSANEGVTALHLAAEGGHVEVVQLLLKAGASVSARTPRNKTRYRCVLEHSNPPGGYTALHLAASCAKEEVVKVLIEAGAELDARIIGDGPSDTAIELADENRCFNTVRLLLEAGAVRGRLRYDVNYYFQKWFEEVGE
jgi:ankyrin repeat protein